MRLEPEPPFGREIGGHLHVGDQEIVLEDPPLEPQPQHPPQRAARPVAGDQPVSLQRIGTIRRHHLQRHMIRRLRHCLHPVLPPDLDMRPSGPRRLDGIMQEGLEPWLLQVDEGRHRMPTLRQQVEFVQKPVIMEHLAKVPLHALRQHRPRRPQPVANLKRPLGKAQRAAPQPRPLVIVQQQDGNPPQPQIQRKRKPHRPAPNHDHPMAHRRCSALIRRLRIRIKPGRQRIAVGHVMLHRAPLPQPCSAAHISRSRCAVQMRGWAIPRASS